MIKSITAENYLGEKIKIKLTDMDPDHGLLVKSVRGLGPAKADISTTTLSGYDGSLYNSARVNPRNIVMEFYFTNSPRIEDARQRTYQYFPLKKPVNLTIETDNRVVETVGYVESNEVDLWSQAEFNQVSLICPDPYFYALDEITTLLWGSNPTFEFPFSNEIGTSPVGTKNLEFSQIEITTDKVIYYDGEVDTGVNISIRCLGPLGNIIMYNMGTQETMKVDTAMIATITGEPVKYGDEILINTKKGSKSIQLLRSGLYTNIFNCLRRDTDWFTLSKGDNYFKYFIESGENNAIITIKHKNAYEGV